MGHGVGGATAGAEGPHLAKQGVCQLPRHDLGRHPRHRVPGLTPPLPVAALPGHRLHQMGVARVSGRPHRERQGGRVCGWVGGKFEDSDRPEVRRVDGLCSCRE